VRHTYRSQNGTRVVRLHTWNSGSVASIRKVERAGCYVPDIKTGKPHLVLGMKATFKVD
jgi:hypothetical protein